MRLGISTGRSGQLARPAAIRALACAAEQVGYSSIWALDGMHGTGSSSEMQTLEPLTVTAAAAAWTARIRLGAGLVLSPRHDPHLLARSLTTLDRLTEGRLSVSLHAGGSEDGYRQLEETLAALDRRHPPILLRTSTLHPVELVSTGADGWDATGVPCRLVAPAWDRIRTLAAAQGRDPESLQLLVQAEIELTDTPLAGDRPTYHGSAEQVAEDIETAGRAGVDEVVLGLVGNPGLDEALDGYARIAEATTLRAAA